MRKLILLLLSCLIFIAGCAINPVTGERELSLVSESQEIAIGRQQFGPGRQMQGGDYALDRELTAYVSEVGQRLVQVSDRQLPYEFVVLNNSTPNAWTLPGGKIAVNRGLLLELKNEAELAAVISHEIVHAAARHGAKNMERGLLLQGAIMATGFATQGSNYANLAVGGAQLASQLIFSKYGRDAESEADYYGMLYMSRAGYDPQAAVELQQTFVRLAEDRSSNWLSGLFASHPPSEGRVAENARTLNTLPPGGMLFADRYQQKIARLRESQAAYKAYDQGRRALDEKKYSEARQLADRAVSIEPREGQFHALQGDINLAQKQYRSAISDFDRAVDQPGDFFYFFLQRGLSHAELNNLPGARADLEKSVELLPTATAYNALGNIEMASGSRQKAKDYFRAAAASSSTSGRQAYMSLVRLDLPENPAAYIQTGLNIGSDGKIYAELTNSTPVSIRNIRLLIRYPDGRGLMHSTEQQFYGTIAPQTAATVPLGLQAPADPARQRAFSAAVVSAMIVE